METLESTKTCKVFMSLPKHLVEEDTPELEKMRSCLVAMVFDQFGKSRGKLLPARCKRQSVLGRIAREGKCLPRGKVSTHRQWWCRIAPRHQRGHFSLYSLLLGVQQRVL